ncbi:UvrD-helicase domain-containing protein [Mucilaginibacter gilvus]|uniref:DNA 3'-5' helicase n=1 Tax=Mucilaginibacter gilvus TaxID=2305909 RepID=A0A444MPQ9_9SPHI|nr:ATP-dependent helicase [Mucilaginibacter gilvus]RWY52614.1 ATP-dependent helicase [Mucilaginibacter gilvus]
MTLDEIKEKIRGLHLGDAKQLDAIFTTEKRLLIEAPAGYGKTKTMVSKIAYMLASGSIPYPKRLLALTFSVNAAMKIKKDVTHQIPLILEGVKTDYTISEKILVSNYHGFARRLLKRSGYKLHPALINIDELKIIDDSKATYLLSNVNGLSYTSASILEKFNEEVKKINGTYIQNNLAAYNQVLINDFLSRGLLTYNGILTLAAKLLTDFEVVREFYRRLYTTVLVDEFQDTNVLSYLLLYYLIGANTQVILMGDDLQRIYGFIGAVPNLLTKAATQFGLTKISLDQNYRFKDNKQMLSLDQNIRRNAEQPRDPQITENATVDFNSYPDHATESAAIVDKCKYLISTDPDSHVAILVKQRGPNVVTIMGTFQAAGVPYFYGLFSDEDPKYVEFNRECLYEFFEQIKLKDQVTKKLLAAITVKLKAKYDITDPLYSSLFQLLAILFEKVFTDFSYLSNQEKKDLLIETLEGNGLKQYVEFINATVILTTVHGSKGLEWPYVILPDMEEQSFPNYYGLCGGCPYNNTCNLTVTDANEHKYLEELSVFYVAVTRARKQVYFTSSNTAINYKGEVVNRNISCLLKIKGIQILSSS